MTDKNKNVSVTVNKSDDLPDEYEGYQADVFLNDNGCLVVTIFVRECTPNGIVENALSKRAIYAKGQWLSVYIDNNQAESNEGVSAKQEVLKS